MYRNFVIIGAIVCIGISSYANTALPDELDIRYHSDSLRDPPETPTRVNIGVELMEVYSIEPASVENPQIKAQFKLRLQWIDQRHASNKSDQHELHDFQDEEAEKKLAEMFDPKIRLVDGTTQFDHQHLRIYPNGLITFSEVVTVTTPANMVLDHFPFDSQIFKFRFASVYWDEEELQLSANPLETSLRPGAAPESWSFDYYSNYVTNNVIKGHAERFDVVKFLVHAKRDPRYFIWRIFLPLIVIVVLSWNVFWMYEDATSALGNCFVFLLTVVAFHQIANGMLPMIPAFVFMDAIVFLCYGFIIIPTFQVMVTTKLERSGQSQQAEAIRRLCRWSVPTLFALAILATTLLYFFRV
jgi:hypothetical protein